MNATLRHAATEALDGLDLDLFCLELEHQVMTRFTADIKRVLDERDAVFRAKLAAYPAVIAERERYQRERADYLRRKERRQFVASGEAARAAEEECHRSRPPLQELAATLAQHWNAPLTVEPRLQSSKP